MLGKYPPPPPDVLPVGCSVSKCGVGLRHNANQTSNLQVNGWHERDTWQQGWKQLEEVMDRRRELMWHSDRRCRAELSSAAESTTVALAQSPSSSPHSALLLLHTPANWGTSLYYLHHLSIVCTHMFLWKLKLPVWGCKQTSTRKAYTVVLRKSLDIVKELEIISIRAFQRMFHWTYPPSDFY